MKKINLLFALLLSATLLKAQAPEGKGCADIECESGSRYGWYRSGR